MTTNKKIKIDSIDENSQHLSSVIELWGANRATLGFLPKDAFKERAMKRQILVAVTHEGVCIGYLLYRNSYDRITIVHLCVAPSHRGQGIPKLLVDELKKITVEKYCGIGLSCRYDYGLQDMWSSLGFVYKHEKPGRSKDKSILMFWWFDHGHPNLFSTASIQKLKSKLCVVIDRDIFSELYTDETVNTEESKSLLSDWLEPELELCITEEIFNYISFISEEQERKLQKEMAQSFTCLPCDTQIFNTVKKNLEILLSQNNINISEIDTRHLARAIASDSYIFVTKKQQLLRISDEIYEKFKLSLITPNELIIQLDEFRNKPDYQPVRLAGSLLKQIPVKKGQEDLLTQYFVNGNQGEKATLFQQLLLRFITEKDKFECYVIFDSENQPLALFVYGRHKKYELEIPIIRVGKNSLSGTLARHIIYQSILNSAHENRQFTRITDFFLEEPVISAIHEDNFVRVSNGWLKVNIAIAEAASQISLQLNTLAAQLGEEYNFCLQIADSLNKYNKIRDVQASANLEKFLFPAKIIDTQIPSFIIPIKPRWAQDLFDVNLGKQTLFGSKIELAFNREAVYYRAAINSRGLQSLSRVLWYVTQDEYNSYCGVSCIRACSFVDEVVIGKPKDLYQRFQRLGVYKLSDILKVSPNKYGNIMAIRFSNTELFDYPIELNKIQDILNKKESFQSPCNCTVYFQQLYNLGTKNKA